MAVVIVSLTLMSTPCWADGDQQVAVIANRDGKITAIYETSFQIDHKTYSLTPDAVILDRHGDPLTTSDFRVDIEVKYHLLKGTADKIDQIVLYLPL
ncbi:hypothetical protein [Nitrospira moscoviensis]|nr:hypothetical protein [Nitrospira moscoviensis]